MKKMKTMKLIRFEPIIIVVLVLVVASLNMGAFAYRSLTTPPGRNFIGSQFYTDDYAVYVSYLKQGQQNRWQTVDKFTAEPHSPSLIHEEYLLWGKLTGLFKISPVSAYHLARFFGALGLLMAFYFFLLKIFPKASEAGLRIGSFALGTLSAGFLQNNRQLFLNWLTDLDITQRFAPVPHYQLGFIGFLLVLVSFYLLVNQVSKKSAKKWFLVVILASLISGFALPSSLIVVLSVLAVFGLFNLVGLVLEGKKEFLKIVKLVILISLIILIVNLPTLFYYQWIFKVSPWSHILAWERANRGPFTLKEYLMALGPIAFLAPLGLLAIKKRKKLVTFLVAWGLTVFGWSFWLADLIGLNPTRFLQALVYIPLAILTALGLDKLARKLVGGNHAWWWLVGVVLIVLIGLPTSQVSLKNQFEMYADFTDLIYPEDYFLKAYDFLETETSPEEVVLTLYQSGNHLPFLSGQTVFLGHLQETLNYQPKVKLAKDFFSGRLSEPEAKDFLVQNRISLVFWGPQEKSIGGKIEKYSFLKPIYESQKVTIFKFENVEND